MQAQLTNAFDDELIKEAVAGLARMVSGGLRTAKPAASAGRALSAAPKMPGMGGLPKPAVPKLPTAQVPAAPKSGVVATPVPPANSNQFQRLSTPTTPGGLKAAPSPAAPGAAQVAGKGVADGSATHWPHDFPGYKPPAQSTVPTATPQVPTAAARPKPAANIDATFVPEEVTVKGESDFAKPALELGADRDAKRLQEAYQGKYQYPTQYLSHNSQDVFKMKIPGVLQQQVRAHPLVKQHGMAPHAFMDMAMNNQKFLARRSGMHDYRADPEAAIRAILAGDGKVMQKMSALFTKLATDLTQEQRANIPKKDFALTKKQTDTVPKYPIHDEQHARLAVAFAKMHASEQQRAEVYKDVAKRYPHLAAKSSVPELRQLTPTQKTAMSVAAPIGKALANRSPGVLRTVGEHLSDRSGAYDLAGLGILAAPGIRHLNHERKNYQAGKPVDKGSIFDAGAETLGLATLAAPVAAGLLMGKRGH